MAVQENTHPYALVVDDHETFTDQITHVLHQLGFKVESTFDGLDALKRSKSSRFDVAVCDVRMARLSGLIFLSNLSRTPASMPKIIMASVLYDNSIRRQALATGASAYLLKPISMQAVKDANDTALAKP